MATTIIDGSLPISKLSPSLPDCDSNTIRAIVTLIWPYSSSTRSCALLLAERDFRLRRHKGQVRVQLSGTCARRVAESGVGIGDEVVLSLRGAKWLKNDGVIQTPGKSVDWELRYEQKLDLEIRKDSQTHTILKVDRSSSPGDCPSAGLGSIKRTLGRVQRSSDQWASPAFAKQRLPSGTYEQVFDLFHDRERKRRRVSWRGSSEWRLVDGEISPAKGDTLLADDEEILTDACERPSMSPLQHLSTTRGGTSPSQSNALNSNMAVLAGSETGSLLRPIHFDLFKVAGPESPPPEIGELIDAPHPAFQSPDTAHNFVESSAPGNLVTKDATESLPRPTDHARTEEHVSSTLSKTESGTTEARKVNAGVDGVDQGTQVLDTAKLHEIIRGEPFSHTRHFTRHSPDTVDYADFEDDEDESDDDRFAAAYDSTDVDETEDGDEDEDKDEIYDDKEQDSMIGIEKDMDDRGDSEHASLRSDSDEASEEVDTSGEDGIDSEDEQSQNMGRSTQHDRNSQATLVIVDLANDSDDQTEEVVPRPARTKHVIDPSIGHNGVGDSDQGQLRTLSLPEQHLAPKVDTAMKPTYLSPNTSVPLSNTAPHTPILDPLKSPVLPLVSPFPHDFAPSLVETLLGPDSQHMTAGLSQTAIIANRPESIFSLQSHVQILQDNTSTAPEKDQEGSEYVGAQALALYRQDFQDSIGTLVHEPQHDPHKTNIRISDLSRTAENLLQDNTDVAAPNINDEISIQGSIVSIVNHSKQHSVDSIHQASEDSRAVTRSAENGTEEIEAQSREDYQACRLSVSAADESQLDRGRVIYEAANGKMHPPSSSFISPQSSTNPDIYGIPPSTETTIIDLGSDDEDSEVDHNRSISKDQPPDTETSEDHLSMRTSQDQAEDTDICDNGTNEGRDEEYTSLHTGGDARDGYDYGEDVDNALSSPSSSLSSLPELSVLLTQTASQHKAPQHRVKGKVEPPKSSLKGSRRSTEHVLFVKDSEEPSLLSDATISTQVTSDADTDFPGDLRDHETGTGSMAVVNAVDDVPITDTIRNWKDLDSDMLPDRNPVEPPQEPQITQAISQVVSDTYVSRPGDLNLDSPLSSGANETEAPVDLPDTKGFENITGHDLDLDLADYSQDHTPSSFHGQEVVSTPSAKIIAYALNKRPSERNAVGYGASQDEVVDGTTSYSPSQMEDLDNHSVSSYTTAHIPKVVSCPPPLVIEETNVDTQPDTQEESYVQNAVQLLISSPPNSTKEPMITTALSPPNMQIAHLISSPPATIQETYDARTQEDSAGASQRLPANRVHHQSDNEPYSPLNDSRLVEVNTQVNGEVNFEPDLPGPERNYVPDSVVTYSNLKLPSQVSTPQFIISNDYSATRFETLPYTPDPSQLETNGLREYSQLAQVDSIMPITPQLTQQTNSDFSMRSHDSDVGQELEMMQEGEGQLRTGAPYRPGLQNEQVTPAVTKDNTTKDVETDQSPKGSRPKRKSDVPRILSPWFAPSSGNQPKSLRANEIKEVSQGIGTPSPQLSDSPSRHLRSHSKKVLKENVNISPNKTNDDALTSPSKPVAGHTQGLRTSMSYYSPLLSIQGHLNGHTASLDVLALCLTINKRSMRTPKGARDYYTSFFITDTSIYPQRRNVQCFRPWKAALPETAPGDVVLLREMKVRGYKTKKGDSATGLYSGEGSAWCVWRFDESAQDNKPIWAVKHDAGTRLGKEEIKGPPVEIGDDERKEARRLRQWWLEEVREDVDESTFALGIPESEDNAFLQAQN
ncbi:hypothetical protein EJ05DRAFT_541544 [Pseudovirgaria hyperparasitica]|uniref:Telomeric single stranded DNA binding POT1/Cdc13 domain-containing protein n=1 Tax=Pseudovirgaria hyperparasitica TaxID=470096 RepID=A0A6A6VWA6_9PEZI|nr:uncharacterized protein EJ05DRAFT_541544 [Pseudovirgaria hyperparasitica]KAF2753984.1 hypothetical protein EJ05DRAFT_541544 [Pseudovirgaria hyperparasitica]